MAKVTMLGYQKRPMRPTAIFISAPPRGYKKAPDAPPVTAADAPEGSGVRPGPSSPGDIDQADGHHSDDAAGHDLDV
jgi:hypothetical protein